MSFYKMFIFFVFTFSMCFCTKNVSKLDEQFAAYKECLDSRRKVLQWIPLVAAKAIVAQKFSDVEMDCFECLSPITRRELSSVNRNIAQKYKQWLESGVIAKDVIPIKWYFRSINGTIKYELSSRHHNEETGRLTIKNALMNHTGLYFCYYEKNEKPRFMATYFLDVIRALPITLDIEGVTEPVKLESSYLVNYNLKVFTDWSSWTGCDRCDQPGEDRRRGHCMVEPLNRYKSLWAQLEFLMALFSYKIPCLSSMLPLELRDYIRTEIRVIEQIRPCQVPCPPKASVRVIKETINGQESVVDRIPPGEYTIKEGVPPPPAPVQRDSVERYVGERALLQCPGAVPGPKHWICDNKTINSTQLYSNFSYRIILDSDFQLLLTNLTTHDAGLYSCWTWDNVLLMTSDLEVREYSSWKKIEAYVKLIIAFSVIVTLIIMVGWKVSRLKAFKKA